MEPLFKDVTHRLAVAAIAATFILGAPTYASAQTGAGDQVPTVVILGQVTAFGDGILTVKAHGGDVARIGVGKKARIATLIRAKFSDIKKGDFIASAGMRQPDGTLRAIEVRLFPAGTRHPREVHRKFRLGPESTMTNATVDAFVGDISKRTFKVKYKGGEQTITVPEDTLVMRQGEGSADLLKPGANVSVTAREATDGKLDAIRIKVGVDGLVPPT